MTRARGTRSVMTARVRDDLAAYGERIYDHKTGQYFDASEVGNALIHSEDEYRSRVFVITEKSGFFLEFDSIDLDFEQVWR